MGEFYGETKSVIICDPEEDYANALAFYLMNRKELSIQVQVCTGLKHLKQIQEKTKTDYLLVSDAFPTEERQKILSEKRYLLVSDRGNHGEDEEIPIYKYQSGDKIIECILLDTSPEEDSLFRSNRSSGNLRIIGVFSPVHRVGKTSYALRLGEELGKSKSVLYLNLELYGGIGGHFEEGEETLADVLYYARQEKGNLGILLAMNARHKGGLDYILPIKTSEDLKKLEPGEWRRLLLRIAEQSIYEVLILDLDEGVAGLMELLEACTEIHLLERKDVYAQAKIRQFERELSLYHREDVLEKIQKVGGGTLGRTGRTERKDTGRA